MLEKVKFLCCGFVTFCFIITCTTIIVEQAYSAEKTPVTRYWMSVSTDKSGFPGMPSGTGRPAMPGIGSLFGMGGDSGSSGKRLHLEVNSPKGLPADPQANHDIPPAQNMGPTLPLVPPEAGRTYEGSHVERPEKMEKPKMRMVIYWGCSETIRTGQPYVIDTEKASPAEFGKMFQGRNIAGQHLSPRPGWAYADWPNKKDGKQVPANSSLVGNHFVHGNYLPDIRFAIDAGHDFMAPVEFTSTKGNPSDSFYFQWNSIPTATGYFATAMGHDQKTGTMIVWSSSDVREAGWSLMNYLSNEDVRQLVRQRVVMPPSTTRCVIPRGIFKDAQGAMVQFIAYGNELNIVYPTKPKEPIWAVKVRRKSTSMLPLMEMSAREGGTEGAVEPEKKEGITPGKVLKGLFGF
ncbi:MAG: hypothetical protein PHT96_11520 [Syntrophorhabdaceae bacterium]|nr:hypothetical protein [Syntrophorhabdaceae bacterium]MDD4197013.1 hypothetical protein [Syntrophorhabdaceae bacterium]